MIVMCEGCETSFNVDDRMIKPTGSKVRCSKCRHIFVAYPAAADSTDEPLTLQDEIKPAAVLGKTTGQEEIDSQLDALFNDKTAGQGGAAPAEQEPELINVDDLLAGDAPAGDPLKAEKLGDDLGIDLDLGLNLEADSGEEEQPGKTPFQTAAGAPEDDRGEPSIDFSMDLEPSANSAAEESLPSLDELEISLDDLDQFDEAVNPAAAEASASAAAPGGELELDLDLEALTPDGDGASLEDAAQAGPGTAVEPASAEGETAGKTADEDELDLSDLEAMLEGEESPEASTAAASPGVDLNLDLEPPPADDGQSGEMQALDLNAIAGAPEESPAPAGASEDELDFSDISGILDEKTPAIADRNVKEPAQELDLVFDNEAPSTASGAPPEAPSEPQQDLMLDIESLLEDGEVQKPAPAATQDLELDFGAEPARAEASDLEIEIEPVDEGPHAEAAVSPLAGTAATATIAAAGEARAAAASGPPDKALPPTDEFSTDEFAQAGMTGATDMLETEVPKKARPLDKKMKAPRRSAGRKLVVTILAVLVLAIAALVIPRHLGIQIPYLSDVEIPYLNEYLKDLEIPYLGKVFQSEPEDTAGNLKITPVPESLSAEFIDNPGAGRLCVIKGQVRNNYDHPRSYIRVTAKLYSKNKTVAKTATVFAGNVFSNQELASENLAAITARFKNKNGINNLNVAVKPGRSIPFMAVFDNLPGNLDEYSVEVTGSSK